MSYYGHPPPTNTHYRYPQEPVRGYSSDRGGRESERRYRDEYEDEYARQRERERERERDRAPYQDPYRAPYQEPYQAPYQPSYQPYTGGGRSDYDYRLDSQYGPTRSRSERDRPSSIITAPYMAPPPPPAPAAAPPSDPSAYVPKRHHNGRRTPAEYYKPPSVKLAEAAAAAAKAKEENGRDKDIEMAASSETGSTPLIDLNTPRSTPRSERSTPPLINLSPRRGAASPVSGSQQGGRSGSPKQRQGSPAQSQTSNPGRRLSPQAQSQASRNGQQQNARRPPPRRDPYKERMAAISPPAASAPTAPAAPTSAAAVAPAPIAASPPSQQAEPISAADKAEQVIRRLEQEAREQEKSETEKAKRERLDAKLFGLLERKSPGAGGDGVAGPSRMILQNPSRAQPTGINHHTQVMRPAPIVKGPTVHPWGQETTPYVSAWTLTQSTPDPRTTIPHHLLYPVSFPPRLSHQVLKAWMQSAPSQRQKDEVKRVIANVEFMMKSRYGFHGVVEPFGSVSWGGEVRSEKAVDLDLMLRDFDRPLGYTQNLWNTGGSMKNRNLPQMYDVDDVTRYLRTKGFKELEAVRFAATPIVKFKDWKTGIACDLNVNDLGGFYNSSLMAAYCKMSPFVLRPLIAIVKMWAKARNLNDAAGSTGPATISSYCWGLMCILYLQTQNRLPNLQDPARVQKAGRTDCHAWVGWGKDEGTYLHADFVDGLDPDDPEYGRDWDNSRPDSQDPWGIEDAVRGFFNFYANAADPLVRATDMDGKEVIKTETHVFSVRAGGVIPRGRRIDEEGLKLVAAEDAALEQRKKEEQDRLKETEAIEAALIGDTGTGVPNLANVQVQKPAGLTKKQKQRLKVTSQRPRSADGQPFEWCKARLVVPDPFLKDKNAARSMESKTYPRFVDEILRARDILNHPDASTDHLLYPAPPPPPTKAFLKAQAAAANQARLLAEQRRRIMEMSSRR